MTTHVLIVNERTLKYHLEFLFIGTGGNLSTIDFNNNSSTYLHHSTENSVISMIADFCRIKEGDLVIFYLQQSQNTGEGKFYGVFQVASQVFLDNGGSNQYLSSELGKSLMLRCLIKPYCVHPLGVTEWEALDYITQLKRPDEMIWSLIYRKLKGNRGNTMITLYESDYLINLIKQKNQNWFLNNTTGYSFDCKTQSIICSNTSYQYTGKQELINIYPRMYNKYLNDKQFETHLQAYILQNIDIVLEKIFQCSYELEWLGNEVGCGVGMQRIDIMISVIVNNERIVIPIELKSHAVNHSILIQMQRYVDWLNCYYLRVNKTCKILPVILYRDTNYNIQNDQLFLQYEQDFNQYNGYTCYPLKHIKFNFKNNEIIFA
ncbi:EVE domain-containing protein [Campylobacter sp. RM12640]|uniref:DUF91 domain-containing protein n=1 Tax=unclassified Campylobacter TaxID=2593542 RepID=UPI0030144337|nr:EVE domain-containing protein [Campylobacter sp. RM12640]MBZ7988985.1 EVE domain-containing protein [Campylobacter sp. RM12635]